MDVFEAMDTCRAMRRLRPDPVPRELLERLVHYATRAPSPSNSQHWAFLVVTDAAGRAFLAQLLQQRWAGRAAPEGDDERARMMRNVHYLVEHFARVPAVILVGAADHYPPQDPDSQYVWSAVYPAAQNLIVAARALGLGTVFTTFQRTDEAEIKQHFGVPDDVRLGAMIPVGYPQGRFGPVSRRPVAEVIHWDRW